MVLVEDHGLIAHTLVAALEARSVHACIVDPLDAEDLVAAVLAHDPALVLLDLDLGPDRDGVDLVAPLTAAGAPVVMLSGVRDRVRLARCVAAGAVGLLGKSGSFDALVGAIEAALAGGTLLDDHQRGEHLAVLRRHEAAERDRLAPFARLTPREAEVLAALLAGRSVEQIARSAVVSVTTVRSHIRGVLTKLGVGTQLAATAKAVEAGWQPPPR